MFSSLFTKNLIILTIFSLINALQIPPSTLSINGHPEISLPLKSIKNLIEINEGISRVSIIQEYHNNQNVSLETEYLFPINPDAVFDAFQAKIGNKTFIGWIKEKKQAQKEYQENLQKGNTVAYSEIEKTAIDIMKVKIGNILPDQTIFIKYSYIESLELVLNRFRRFTLYSTLTQRYNPDNSGVPDLQITEIKPCADTYKWEIMVNLTSVGPLETVYSPSHAISITNYQKNEENITIITLDSKESHNPNKDFVLIYQENEPFEPKVLVERHQFYQNSTVAVLSFFPKLNSLSDSEAYGFLKKNNDVALKSDIESSKGEFFFIVDRSGSMSGRRIDNLKRAMALFLKSLPKDSFFNVISFGSNFEPLFPSAKLNSVRYTQENLQIALGMIQNFDADFGGTEIYYPLEAVLNSQIKEEYPKLIFLLTDGDVSNSDQCVNLIKNNLGFARVYTVGIGNGVSASFIKRMAENGKGKFEFVKDDDNLEEKTIHLLHSSISPFAKNLQITFDNEEYVKEIVPKIDNKTMVLKDEMFQFFLFLEDFKNNETTRNFNIKVSYLNSFTRKNEEFLIKFSDSRELEKESDIFHKLAIKKKIKDLSEGLTTQANNDTEQKIVADSIKFQVLSEYTAFITVVAENQNSSIFEREKIMIGNIISDDYLENGEGGSILDKVADMNSNYNYNNYYGNSSPSPYTVNSGSGGSGKSNYGDRTNIWMTMITALILMFAGLFLLL